MIRTSKSQYEIFFKRVDNWILKFFPNKEIGWKIDLKIALLTFVISLFLAFPSLWIYFNQDNLGRLFYQMMQSENPLNRELPQVAQILSYRFFVPTLNYFLGLRSYGVIVIPVISSFLNLFLISRIIRRRTKNIVFSVICVVGISLTWLITEGTAFWSTTDSVSHLILLLPAAFKLNPSYFVFALPCSLFNDERSIFACAFLWLFLLRDELIQIKYPVNMQTNLLNLKLNRKIIFTTISMLVGFILWIIGRYIIDSGILAPRPDISVVTNQLYEFRNFFEGYWGTQILNYLSSFRWVYFFPFFLIIKLTKISTNSLKKIYGFDLKKFFGIYSFGFIFYSVIVMINGDVWRSMSYSYFFVIDSILIVYELDKEFTIKLNRILTPLMLITPVVFFGLNLTPQISFPLPIVLLRTFFGFGESSFSIFYNLFRYVPS